MFLDFSFYSYIPEVLFVSNIFKILKDTLDFTALTVKKVGLHTPSYFTCRVFFVKVSVN